MNMTDDVWTGDENITTAVMLLTRSQTLEQALANDWREHHFKTVGCLGEMVPLTLPTNTGGDR